ncbi:MAG: hypothetical protein JW993_20040 [Sedimentisphaerales bacterium]|nr:hypothetical protein [Sedimentisphaerales bacterium]
MNDDRIKALLESTDRVAGRPSYGPLGVASVRRQARRRQVKTLALPAVAVLLLGFGAWSVRTLTPEPAPRHDERIATLEEQVRQLQAQSEAALALVQEVLAQERQRERLDALEAELASIRDPREELRRQADRTAFTLVYQADRFYRELNQAQSAIEAYEQVIRLFPESRWADEARERLAKIKANGNDRI